MRKPLEDGTQLLPDGRRVVIFRNQARWDHQTWAVDKESKRQALIEHINAIARFLEWHPGSFSPFEGRELIWREWAPQVWVGDRTGDVGEMPPVCEWLTEIVLDQGSLHGD